MAVGKEKSQWDQMCVLVCKVDNLLKGKEDTPSHPFEFHPYRTLIEPVVPFETLKLLVPQDGAKSR